ncbi:cell division protein FtsL [Microbacteriaceae bacterium 4G12]
MSNLAVKYKKQQSQAQVPNQQPKQELQPLKKSKITVLEKTVYIAFIGFLLYAAVTFISNKVSLYEVNTQASKLHNTIEEQKKVNNDLKAQVDALSRYERIAEKAKAMGLQLNENNVKGLNP